MWSGDFRIFSGFLSVCLILLLFSSVSADYEDFYVPYPSESYSCLKALVKSAGVPNFNHVQKKNSRLTRRGFADIVCFILNACSGDGISLEGVAMRKKVCVCFPQIQFLVREFEPELKKTLVFRDIPVIMALIEKQRAAELCEKSKPGFKSFSDSTPDFRN